MGVFPFINTETVQEAASKKLPLFREYAYDFEKHCLKLDDDGRTYLVQGNEALRIWIYFALETARYRYTAYDTTFGSEIEKVDEESPSWNINANVSVHDTRGYGTELSDDRAYGSDFTIMRIALNRVIKCEIRGETFIPLVEVSIDREYLEKDRYLEHWMESEEYQD